jgi:hypothetical protein
MSTTTATPDIVDQYLLNVNMPRDSDVPLEVFIAFPQTLTNNETRERVRKEWLQGNDKQYASMQLMFNHEISCVFRPTGVLIDWANITISLYAPSGLQMYVPAQLLKNLGTTIEQQIANLNDYVYATIEKHENTLVTTTLIPLRGTIQTDIAKEILDKSNYSPLEIILLGLGYRNTSNMKRLFIPRIVSWFKGFDGKPMHIAQFTLPETAKTHWSIRNETLFNWRYIPEPPTLARLILDARMGILGEVFLRNGIVFDEFDKWTIDTPDRRMTFDSILTGMEQGKWVRGVSALGIRPPEVSRLIPILFFGNLGDFQKLYGTLPLCTRAWFTEIYSRRLTHDVSALADRIAIIDACFTKIPVMDNLTNKVLPDSVLRGIIEILQKQVQKVDVSKLKGRLKRHSDNVYAILNTFMKCSPEEADDIVVGTFDFDKHYVQMDAKVTPPIGRDVVQPPQPLTLVSQLDKSAKKNVVYQIITETVKTSGQCERKYLLKELVNKHHLTIQDYHEAVNELMKEGKVYEPQQGFLKTGQ